MKLYIIGPVGSGKTTLAQNLSLYFKIPYYELDNVVYEYNPNGDIKRSKEEIEEIFNEILKQDNWIIEDVGRTVFNKGFEQADKIIYIKLLRIILYKRVIKRWIKQKLKLEKSRYRANLKNLKQMLIWVNDELSDSKLNKLGKYKNKLVVSKHNKVNEIIKYLK